MSITERALEYFNEKKYNCGQAVICAYCDEYGVDDKEIFKLAEGFGGGMGAVQWIACIIGYLGIIYVMFSGARRLEMRQNRTYGDDPEYVKYAKTVPIMIPLIPLYSVERHKWLVA